MFSLFLFGLLASSSLIMGALVGTYCRVPKSFTGIMLAFASGALISAISFELVPEAVDYVGLWVTAACMLLGAGSFVFINTWLDKKAAPISASGDKAKASQITREAASKPVSSQTIGLILLVCVILDGIPENLALGFSMADQASFALLIAIFTSNFPEALVSAVEMQKAGRSKLFIISTWTLAAAILTFFVVLPGFLGNSNPYVLGVMLAFAGGAVLASLADTLMPEAFERGRPLNAFSTVLGFLTAFALAT